MKIIKIITTSPKIDVVIFEQPQMIMIVILSQASIASYPEEMGEGRRHNKRSARMDEQVKS